MSHIDFKRAATVGVEDLVLLPQLSDKTIMENLKLRHAKDIIYTNIGPVLLSVNPFKKISNLYSDERIAFFRSGGKGSGSGAAATALANHGGPHIFGLAEETYRTMVSEEENQCVIISGESGAGKTEASKQIMQYVSAVSGNTAEMQRVKHIILESNPLLEAFGNAKTVRNDNSSRFGKFFEIFFDRLGGPIGGHMSNFLLEKSRVVSQQRGERSFHVFYQMCRGADPSLRNRMRLRPPEEFSYLNQGGALDRAGVDDAAEWKETLAAMEAMSIAPSDQEAIFTTLALILHLGELRFISKNGNGDSDENGGFVVANRDELAFCAELIGLDAVAMERAITWRRLEMGSSEVVNVPLDAQQCCNTRDVIAKALYHHLFDFIVESVNRALGTKPHELMLGVLDIYGFEIFEKNGFEQFCINYVNEKLQQIFIELTLKVEQEEYVRERIPWEEIKYFNNKIVCELIEGTQPPGLFSVIDDVCATMTKEKESVADIKMLDKLDAAHAGNVHFRRTERGFCIRHYAGDVQYNAEGFTNRNKDLLSADVVALLRSSTNKFILEILSDILSDSATGADDFVSSGGAGGRQKRRTTAGFKIRQQAAHLVRTLMGCNPHYVRTIKPNDDKLPNHFDEARVMHQVKYLGLLENVRVRRAGYSYRQYFDRFHKRFRYISPSTFPRAFRGSDRDACAAILQHAGSVLPVGAWQLGERKVFIRQPQHLFALEDMREDAFDLIAGKIQRAWGRYRQHRDGALLRAAIGRAYARAGKARRADSVFRPFAGDYIKYRDAPAALHAVVDYDPIACAWREHDAEGGRRFYHNALLRLSQWDRPREMSPRRVLFAAPVLHVADTRRARLERSLLIITDIAVHMVQERAEPNGGTRYAALKRIDLRLLAALSVTPHADTVLVLHVHQPDPLRDGNGNGNGNGLSEPPRHSAQCDMCGSALSTQNAQTAQARGHKRSGAAHRSQRSQKPQPQAPQQMSHKLCVACAALGPSEGPGDVVLLSAQRTEIAAVLRRAYRQLSGRRLPLAAAAVIAWRAAGAAEPHEIRAEESAAHKNEKAQENEGIAPGPGGALVVAAPPGVPREAMEALEAARERRRAAAAERRRAEEREEREKEEAREREREAEHRRLVEERRRERIAAEERAAEERRRGLEGARERREAEARAVAERATR